MNQPIKLDLRNLTQAHIDEALPHIGQCSYASPCIIGTLVPNDERAMLDNHNDELDADLGLDPTPNIGALIAAGLVEFPTKTQEELAIELQLNFDNEGKMSSSNFGRAVCSVNAALGLDLKVPA